MDLYKLYQYNIWHLINTYKLEYEWIDIKKEKLYNGMKDCEFTNFEKMIQDPWLQKYSNKQEKLGKEIIKIGTYTPFIFQFAQEKKYVILGRHRIYSLNLLNQINRKFLFIKIEPNKTLYNSTSLYFFSDIFPQPKLVNNIITSDLIYNLLINTGDALTSYLWKNNCIPFKPFNDEQSFKEWINNPLEGE